MPAVSITCLHISRQAMPVRSNPATTATPLAGNNKTNIHTEAGVFTCERIPHTLYEIKCSPGVLECTHSGDRRIRIECQRAFYVACHLSTERVCACVSSCGVCVVFVRLDRLSTTERKWQRTSKRKKKQPNQLQFYMIKYFLRTNTHTHEPSRAQRNQIKPVSGLQQSGRDEASS